jgi:hypothetical protein
VGTAASELDRSGGGAELGSGTSGVTVEVGTAGAEGGTVV